MNNCSNLLSVLSLGEFQDTVKFTKLVFELQIKYGLFSYHFFRNDLGPDSFELQEDLEKLLLQQKIVYKSIDTDKGRIKVIQGIDQTVCTWDNSILDFIQNYKNKSRKEILYLVYNKYNIFQYELGDRIFIKS